jgi:hypothetical protein
MGRVADFGTSRTLSLYFSRCVALDLFSALLLLDPVSSGDATVKVDV